MESSRLLIGILLDAAVAVFWLFPDVVFGGSWGILALQYPVIMAVVSAPLIALSLIFFITAFRPRKAGREKISPCIVALLGAILFSSPFFGIDPAEDVYGLNIVLVVVGLLLTVWGGSAMLKNGSRLA